jgi:uncharacterized short protein YbdD (DUF466 family)
MTNDSIALPPRIRNTASRIWRGIREWCGDAAYERYVNSRRKCSCHETLLTREEFYLEQLQKRYSRVSRCC